MAPRQRMRSRKGGGSWAINDREELDFGRIYYDSVPPT